MPGWPPGDPLRRQPPNLTADAAGNIYFMQNNDPQGRGISGAIRKVSTETGIISTVAVNAPEAGSRPAATQSQATPASVTVTKVASARAGQQMCVNGLAVDQRGDLYFSDCKLVRKLAVATGVITTVAGTERPASDFGVGSFGDGGPATSALLRRPTDLAFDTEGNLFIVDRTVVLKVAAKTGIITVVAGSRAEFGTGPVGPGGRATAGRLSAGEFSGLGVDAAGNLYVGEAANDEILKIASGTGIVSVAKTPTRFGGKMSILADRAGNVFFALGDLGFVERIAPGGASTRIAGSYGVDGKSVLDSRGYAGDGGPGNRAKLSGPTGLAMDASGNVYIAETLNHTIRMVAAGTGIISTVFKMSDREAAKSDLAGSNVVAVDQSGSLYFGGNGVIFKVSH